MSIDPLLASDHSFILDHNDTVWDTSVREIISWKNWAEIYSEVESDGEPATTKKP
jgi:hypothetical protein